MWSPGEVPGLTPDGAGQARAAQGGDGYGAATSVAVHKRRFDSDHLHVKTSRDIEDLKWNRTNRCPHCDCTGRVHPCWYCGAEVLIADYIWPAAVYGPEFGQSSFGIPGPQRPDRELFSGEDLDLHDPGA